MKADSLSASGYTPTIGLEVHAELRTETKMFCSSKNDPHAALPNTNVCPVCLAHPGTLPVVNKQAVEHVLTVGAALGATLADYTEFDRKSYFYPDIPKNYQISQYEFPLVSGGELSGVQITRVHLEEDTARSSHEGSASLVDFNRAGVPLMELVTEPVIHDAKQAGAFARELQLLLRTLGVSDANLEKGEMRVEANISVSKDSSFGTKVEVKNLNSFRSVERAIEYEVERQIKTLEEGGKIVQETRGWDENKQQTFSQRLKEGSTDYRYFPEPDIPKIKISDIREWHIESISNKLPELPNQKRARYENLGIKKEDAETLVADVERGRFFDSVSSDLAGSDKAVNLAVNYLVNDLAGKNLPSEKSFSSLIRMLEAGKISSRGAKELLTALSEQPEADPEALAEGMGMLQVSDPTALLEVITAVLEANTAVVEEYKAGKVSSLQFLVGQVMKASKGAADPSLTQHLLLEQLAK